MLWYFFAFGSALFRVTTLEFSVATAVLNFLFFLTPLFFVDLTSVATTTFPLIFFGALLDIPAFFLLTKSVRYMAFSSVTPLFNLGPVMTGVTAQNDPVNIEEVMMRLVPKKDWVVFPHLLILHGRSVCEAKKPKCDHCVLNKICPSAFRFSHFQQTTS